MAKLSKKIKSDETSDFDQKKIKISLSKKISNENHKTKIEQKNEEITEQNTINIPESKKDLLNFFYKEIPIEHFNSFNKEFLNSLFSDENLSNEQITKKIIASLISEKTLKKIKEKLEAYNKNILNILINNEDLEKENNKKTKIIQTLQQELNDAEEQIFLTKKNFSSSVPINNILEIFLENINLEYSKKIKQLLSDAYSNGDKKEKIFVLKFLKGFVWIENAIINLSENEDDNLKLLEEATKKLLSTISGASAPERRLLLDEVANLCNKFLNNYDFISPEQTLQIDPSIHNAEGLGGTIIKEGKSFAITRRDTGKTVIYAEIVTK